MQNNYNSRYLFAWYATLIFLYLLSAPGRCLGQINIGQLHIVPGTTWVSNTGTTVVLDNMDLQYDAGPVLLNNTFRFTGTRINSIRGENRPLIYAISVAKDNPGELVLDQAINVTKRINFEKGMFDMNGSGIFLQPDAMLTNESENSRLVGPFGGYVNIEADLHAPVAANPGNLGAFITSATDLGKVSISRMHDVQRLNDSSQSIARWYSISMPPAGTLSAGLRFNYFYSESEGFPNDSLVLWEHGDETDWTDSGYTTRDASQKYVEKLGLTRLSVFTLAPDPSTSSTTPPPPPPVEGAMLLTGSWNNDAAALNWFIASEYQNDHFDIQRKYATQSDFAPIGSVHTKAPGGTQPTPLAYVYTDSTVKTGPDDIFYRIRQVSINGESTYSNIVAFKARNGSAAFVLKLYPTIAVGGRVYIEVGNMPLARMSFAVVDVKGSIVLTGDLPYRSQWLPVHSLSHGVYRLILRSGSQHWHSTFIR